MSLVFMLAVLLINIILGIGILLRNPGKSVNRYFALFVAALSIWILSNYFENELALIGIDAVVLLLRVDFVSAPLLFYFLLRFATTFTGHVFETPAYKWMRYTFAAASALASLLPFGGTLLLSDITFAGDVIHFSTGPFFFYYAVVLTVSISLSLAVLLAGRRAAVSAGDLIKTRQINYIFFGAALSLGTAVAINLSQAVSPISLELSRIALYGMVFIVFFTAFAVVRAQFFEITFLITRAVIFTTLISICAGMYAFTLFWLVKAALHIVIDTEVLLSAVVVAVIIAASFQYMRQLVEKATDRVLFKGTYDPDIVVKRISQILIEAIELGDVSTQIIKTIREEFRLEKTALLLEADSGISWYAEGFPVTIPEDLGRVLFAPGNSSIIVFDELPEGPTKDLFRKYEVALVVFLRTKDRDIASLVLGNKRSGEAFNAKDMSFLEVLAAEIATGIEKAKSYDELKRLSEELELRVADRTKELEESKKKEIAKAQEVARLKDEFVFLAVHELRTPIVAIRGFLELAEASQKKSPIDTRRNLSAIAEASTHMSHLINDLLEIARSDSGVMKVDVSPQEFPPILDQVIDEVAPLIRQKKIHLEIVVQQIPLVMCDSQKVKEVLINLFANAIKYNREGGSIFITAFCPAGQNQMICEVRDTGYGIPKELQPRIFQKFFRAVTRETQEVVGSGLGLFITRVLVERMGGDLMFSSLEHEGSTFAFTLPLAEADNRS